MCGLSVYLSLPKQKCCRSVHDGVTEVEEIQQFES